MLGPLRRSRRSKQPSRLANLAIGVGIVALILGLRVVGFLEALELLAFDQLSKGLFKDSTDARTVIVGLDDAYMEDAGSPYIDYRTLARLVEHIAQLDPAVIGLDVSKNKLAGGGQEQLIELFDRYPNLYTIEKIVPPRIEPLSGLSASQLSEQIGFNDVVVDQDTKVRTALLGAYADASSQEFKESFAFKLAKHYLRRADPQLEIANGVRDEDTLRIGELEIPQILRRSGGYNNFKVIGLHTLIQFRRAEQPFEILRASDLVEQGITGPDAGAIAGKIVLIGITDTSQSALFNTAVPGRIAEDQQMVGVELQAHIVSQLVNAVLDDRALLRPMTLAEELAYIILFGIVGIAIGYLTPSTLKNLGMLGLMVGLLWSLSYALVLLYGLWFPLVPCFFALFINGIVYIAVLQSERRWRSLVNERNQALTTSQATLQERDAALVSLKTALASLASQRQRTIEHTFDTIHNGPLQTLADLLRRTRDQELTYDEIYTRIESLNQEIRSIGESLKQQAISDEDRLYLTYEVQLDLRVPLHELFYEVYVKTLERDFPGFTTLQVRVRSFDPVPTDCAGYPSIDGKRKLCFFLQEALCNVGKHAIGATRLRVTGKLTDASYALTVSDNGPGYDDMISGAGQGTRIGLEAAKQLGGVFTLRPQQPRGTLCQIVFPLIKLIKPEGGGRKEGRRGRTETFEDESQLG